MDRSERFYRIDQLRFSPEQARRVEAEQWHPRQVGCYAADGSCVPEAPYSQDTELIRDIIKYGPYVEAVAPAGLHTRVGQRRAAAGPAISEYSSGWLIL